MRTIAAFALAIALLAPPSAGFAIGMCGAGKRVTCVVDGDTLWLQGEKFRLQDFDTPETQTGICGGTAEVRLGKKAAARLVDLINNADNATIQRTGHDRYGRTLAILRVEGVSVGDILISEGLARRWPDGPEFWCR